MTTPQVHLIMLGLGLLAYVFITGLRDSRRSKMRQQRRRWWLGSIAAIAVILSPFSRFWREPFNALDLLTQSLLISGFSLILLLAFALLLTPYRAIKRFFRKRRQSVEYVLDRNDTGLTPIAIDANAAVANEQAEDLSQDNPNSLQDILRNRSAMTAASESGIAAEKPAVQAENSKSVKARSDVDQASTEKLDTANIESIVPLHKKTDNAQRLDKNMKRTNAANDKISTEKQIENSLENSINSTPQTDDDPIADQTLQLDEFADDTLQLDELADDTLRLDELLPNGDMPANSELQSDVKHQINDAAQDAKHEQTETDIAQNSDGELLVADELQTDDVLSAEDILLAEEALLAENELDGASIPSDEESLDLSDTEDLFSKIRSQSTEVELPAEKELRDAAKASAMDELDLDSSLVTDDSSIGNIKQINPSNSKTAEVEEAKVIYHDADQADDIADLQFGNDFTGEYAHPVVESAQADDKAVAQSAEEEIELAIERAAQQAQESGQFEDDTHVIEPDVDLVPDQDLAPAQTSAPTTDTDEAEPETLTAAITAAKLTALSVESQVSDLEKSMAKLDDPTSSRSRHRSSKCFVETSNAATGRGRCLTSARTQAYGAIER